jgi:ABC-type glycerol-3-phosphate transport system substrate-binding protein
MVTGDAGAREVAHLAKRQPLLIIKWSLCWFCCWLAILSAAGIMAACEIHTTDSFPTLGTTTSSNSAASQTSSLPSESNGKQHLTVALPLSQDAFDTVRLLFLAKKSGLLNQETGQYIGLQIDPEDLKQFDTDLDIRLYTVPLATGATMLQVSTWQAAAMLPDVIYCQDAAASIGLGQILPLDDLLYQNQLLAATHLFAPLLESVRVQQKLLGIPYLASTTLVYQNVNLIRQLQLEFPKLEWTWDQWLAFSQLAQAAIDQAGLSATPVSLSSLSGDPEGLSNRLAQALFVHDNPAVFLAFLAESFNGQTGYAMWSGQTFQLNNPIFKTSARWLRDYALSGYSTLHLDASQLEVAFGVQTAGSAAIRNSGRILMWAGDSVELREWHQQSKFTVAESFVPTGTSSSQTALPDSSMLDGGQPNQRFPVIVRSLFLSKKTQNPELAADFASFVALDADSLLMQSRYQLYEGLFPVIEDQAVWEALVGRQKYGSFLLGLRARMPESYYGGQQQTPNWQGVMQILQQGLGAQVLMAGDEAQFDDLLTELKYAVSQKMKEG